MITEQTEVELLEHAPDRASEQLEEILDALWSKDKSYASDTGLNFTISRFVDQSP